MVHLGLCLIFSTLFCALRSVAGVVGFDVLSRGPAHETGYEEIVGVLHFEVDPRVSANLVIADLGLAPLNAAGHVEFAADIRVLTPVDALARNGAAWFEIPNRGGKGGVPKGFLGSGFTFIQVGWEFDVSQDSGKLALRVPRARHPDGRAIRGEVSAVFTPDRPLEWFDLTDLREYPPADRVAPEGRLIVRDRAAFPGGVEIAGDRWRLDGGKVWLEGGLTAGTTYQVFYESEAPPIAGLGYAAVRDAVEWFRYADSSPIRVSRAYAFGSSQCGRFLRDLVYLGFNTDEHERCVFDGMMVHIAGAGRLVLNQRWATPRSLAGYETASYPFADHAWSDSESEALEGVLENRRVRHAPRIFYTNTGAEYWGGGRVAALTHTDPAGKEDRDLPVNVRSYFFSGTAHGATGFPPATPSKGWLRGNPVNPGPVIIALRHAMHRWVTEGVEPPESVFPRFRDRTLTNIRDLDFPMVPGVASPRTVSAGGRVANPFFSGGAGAGRELPLVVPRVDADGHDMGGIRMPEVAVPLGTALGWAFRPEVTGSPHELYLLRGAWVPLPRTRGDRDPKFDSRVPIDERYAGRTAYLQRIEMAARELVERRLLLEADVELQVRLAGERWDWVMRGSDR
jgi:hypothetical protein